MKSSVKLILLLGAAGLALGATSARAESVEDFYKGKRMLLLIGNSPGGAYDTYARLLARHMNRYIPGQPNIVSQNMQGAGTLVMTNYLYNVAPKDGSVFGNPHERMGLEPKIAPKGTSYDGRRFVWLGSMNKVNSVCLTWHSSGVKTIEDARAREVITGGAGGAGSSAVFPRVLNHVLGTKFRLINGYQGNDIVVALERGEIESRCGFSWASLKATNHHWVTEKKVNLILQMGLDKHPELPDVPNIMDLVTKDDDRKALDLLFATQEMGRPFMAPPGIPADRAKALRAAFMASMEDRKFLDEAQKLHLEIQPVSGEYIQDLLERLYAYPDEIARRVAAYRHPVQDMEADLKIKMVPTTIDALAEKGRLLQFKAEGKTHSARLAKGTKIRVDGKKAKRDALKAGMACDFDYYGEGGQAKAVNCK